MREALRAQVPLEAANWKMGSLGHSTEAQAQEAEDSLGRLGSNGWVSVKEAAEAMQVSEEDIKESVGWQRK